jgi:hypothetical protein
LNSLISLQTSIDSYVAVEKYLLKKQGVIRSSASRSPHGYFMDRETEQEIDRLYDILSASAMLIS